MTVNSGGTLSLTGGTASIFTNSLTLNGTLSVSTGTLNAGSVSGNGINYGNGATISVSGGLVNVASQLAPVTSTNTLTYTQSNGTVTLGIKGTTGNNTLGIPASGSTFNMSGGSLIIEQVSNLVDYINAATNGTVTGGTVQFGDSLTTASSAFIIDSVAPVFNITFFTGTTLSTGVQTDTLKVKGNLTIQAGHTFTTNITNNTTISVNIAGNWTNSGTFTPGTGTITFNGTAAQSISGTSSTTFNNLVITNTGATVTLSTAATITGAASSVVSGAILATSVGLTNNGTLSVNGTFQINSGGFISGTAPTYGSTSTLIYNTPSGFGVGTEWTGNSTTAGLGVPQNVTIQAGTVTMPTTTRGMAGNLNINAGTLALNATSGDLAVGGNWTRAAAATFTPNNRAVFFNGAATQTITVAAGGTEAFAYLVVAKSANNLTLAGSPNATNATVNAAVGDVLQITNAGGIDLNGQTMTLPNNGGNILVSGGARTITGAAGSTFIISGASAGLAKTVTTTGGGTLSFGSNVLVILNKGLDFGAGVSTVNGTLQINTGGFVQTNAPTYGSASLLKYNTGSNFTLGSEWQTGASGAGVPQNVQLSTTGTILDFGSINNSRTARGNVTIDTGCTLQLSSQPGGDLNLGGNWANNGTFNNNNRTVTFNGAQNQSIGGANSTTFAFLSISNTGTSPSNVVSLAKDTIDTQALNITQGVFDQSTTFNLTSNAITVSSGATFQNLGTGDLTLSGDVSNSGTINFNANGTPCGDADSILIRSSVNGTQRAWNGAGTFNMTDVDVKDQSGTAAILVRNGTNSGNNGVNWVFFAGCTGASYTWGGPTSGTADWNISTNWTPTRAVPDPGDILTIDGTVTIGPTIINVPTQTIAAFRVTNGAQPKLSTNAANTLTISGATGTDLTVPSGTSLTLQGASPLTIKIASGSTGTVGGLVLLQDGPHRLIGSAANAVTFLSGAFGTTQTGESVNPFGTGAAGDGAANSIIFNSGAHYFHNDGQSPFGAAGNPSIVVFQTGSDANWLTNTGFQANGRTYADLNLGKTGPGAITVNVSDSGTGNFQFDNLNVFSNSSLAYNGSGASSITIQGNITSDGTGAPSNDVTLTAGTGGIILNKAGTQVFSATGTAKTITFGSNGSVNSGTTLALTNRVVNVTSGTLSVLGSLTRTTGYVIGNLLKPLAAGTNTFEVGTINGYSPVSLNVTNGAGNNFTARAVQGPQPNIQTPTKALQRYWTLTASGVMADVTFNYLDPPDVPATATESAFIIFKYEPGSSSSGFTTPGTATNATYDFANNRATITGVSSFSDWTLAEAIAPTAVKLKDFKANANDNGEVMIEWQSGYEVNNLGYNIYRQEIKPRRLGVFKPDSAQRQKVTPSLVAGSALLTAGRTVLTAGQAYTWFDKVEAGSRVQYWLEDVDVNGTRTMHGPINVGSNHFTRSISKQALLLNQLKPNDNAGGGAVLVQGSGLQAQSAPSANTSRAGVRNPGDLNAPSPTMQQTIAAMPGVKLSVSRDGWYRVSQPELQAAGLDLSGDASLLKLYANGKEVPIELSGDQHHLTPVDTMEFYGRALNSPTDAAQVYYLVVGSSAGRRIPRSQAGADPDVMMVAGSFNYTLQRTEKLTYFPGLDNQDADSFFGQIITAAPVNETLAVSHPSGDDLDSQGAQLEVRLQGVTSTAHHVRVLFNGTDAGTLDFANTDNSAQSLALPGDAVHEGDNTVQLVALGGDSDVSLVDTLRLSYAHTYTADNDSLAVNASSKGPLSVAGFASANIRVVDMMDAKSTQEWIPTVQAQPDGTYTATIQPAPLPSGSQHALLFFADSRTIHPDAITKNEPSTWGRGGDGANFVIITHRDFKQNVEPLAELRRSQGMTVNVVDVEDIYDEFSYGAHSPQAVRDFLSAAMSKWETKPGYVLLVGDATYDPKNYLGQGANDLVPTKLLWAASMKTASDDWMADLDGDGIPELALGRLPVRTAGEADTMIGKIVNYVAGQAGQGALLVADRNGGDDFEGASNTVQQQLPSGMPVEVVNRGTQDTNAVRSRIIGDLNQGPMVVNYFGHGSVGLWTGAGLLTTTDATALTNGNRLPLFTMMTCLNGYFHDVSGDSMAEALLKAQSGGAVAVWASSGQSGMNGQLQVAGPLYQLLFGGQPVRLGDAIRGAKSATGDQTVRRSWIFFGDPTMRLR